MNESFDLLSSMSPKCKKNVKFTKHKGPSTLALKKNFRRSSILHVSKATKNETVISISSNESDFMIKKKESSIIELVSDEDSSNIIEKTPEKLVEMNVKAKKLSIEDKYSNIQHWVDDVNKAKFENDDKDVLGICFKSLALDDDLNINCNKTPITTPIKKNVSAEYLDFSKLLSNDEIIPKTIENNEESEEFDEIIENNTDAVSLLDSLYGKSWRANAINILPSSETKIKKNVTKNREENLSQTERAKKTTNFYKNPYLNSENNSSKKLLDTLQKARFKKAIESPWRNVIKKLCDSDTSDNYSEFTPKKLEFDDEDKENDSLNKLTFSASEDAKIPRYKSKKKFIVSDSESDSATSSSDSSSSNKKKYAIEIEKTKSAKKLTTKSYTFLESLSKNVPLLECDMGARIFRNNFKQHKDELIKKLFSLYNEKIFDNKIPADSPIVWNDRMRGTAGFCYCRKITRRTGAVEREIRIALSTKVLDSADRLRDTLVHELCHAATWIINEVSDGHGPFWRGWANRAMKAFPELPPIERCHQYVINTKYTYRCVDCGYSIGRHSKSLDIQRKRCGHCYGKFEVLINKVNKDGERKAVPTSAKKQATGFALFVKENYSNYKQSNLKHADVMKILGQKFAEIKVHKV